MRVLAVSLLALGSLINLGCAGRQAPRSGHLQPAYPGASVYQGTPPWTAPQGQSGPAAAVSFAEAHLGTPYCWGGTGPSCYDCSGLTSSAWLAAGKKIPRSSSDQLAGLPGVPMDSIAPGDIVWRPGHVALYVGQGWVISAPGRGDVVKYAPIKGYSRAMRP